MATIVIQIGTDAQVISVTSGTPGIRREIRSATGFRDALGILERRLPSPSPTIEFERFQARKAIAATTHLTPLQKATAQAQIAAATESDKIVFDGPYPVPEGAGLLDQPAGLGGDGPARPPLVIVFLDP